MNAIEEIKERLREYPDAEVKAEDNYVVVSPRSERGFEVGFAVLEEDEYRVNFEGWYERFEDEGEALNYFSFGLSGGCRIKECRRGGVAYRWTLEVREAGAWVDGGTVALFFFPFWRKKEVRYLQNGPAGRGGAAGPGS